MLKELQGIRNNLERVAVKVYPENPVVGEIMSAASKVVEIGIRYYISDNNYNIKDSAEQFNDIGAYNLADIYRAAGKYIEQYIKIESGV